MEDMEYLRKLQGELNNPKDEIDTVNEDANSPYIKPKYELDPKKEYENTIKEVRERLNKPEEELTWKDRLPDMLAAAHNIINYSKGNTLPNIEMGYADKILQNRKDKKKQDISGLEKLQKMHQQYMDMQRTDRQDKLGMDKFDWTKSRAENQDAFEKKKYEDSATNRELSTKILQDKLNQSGKLTPYQQAQLELANKMTPYQQEQLNLAKSKLENEGKLSEYQKAQIALKEKELSNKATPKEKGDIKEQANIRKQNIKERKKAEKSINDLDSQLEKIKRAKSLLQDLVKDTTIADTGPIDQYASTFTSKGQKLRQSFNDLSLEKMSKLFQGMSKAVDSDAERKMFEQSQANMGNYPDVNIDILNQMEKSILSLKDKNKTLVNRYNEKGEEIDTSKESSSGEVKRKTKDGRTAIFNKDTKEFIRYE